MRDAERRDAEKRDAEKRDAEKRDAERRDAERRDAERRDAEKRDVKRRDRIFEIQLLWPRVRWSRFGLALGCLVYSVRSGDRKGTGGWAGAHYTVVLIDGVQLLRRSGLAFGTIIHLLSLLLRPAGALLLLLQALYVLV